MQSINDEDLAPIKIKTGYLCLNCKKSNRSKFLYVLIFATFFTVKNQFIKKFIFVFI